MKVELYNLRAGNGNHIRKATKVTMDDGKVYRFMERLSKKEAVRQVKYQLESMSRKQANKPKEARMSWLTEMHFYWWKKGNKICVQNMIAGMCGQYHEHSPKDFETWKQNCKKHMTNFNDYLHERSN